MEPVKVYNIVPSGPGHVVVDAGNNSQMFQATVFPSRQVALDALGEMASKKRWRMSVSHTEDKRIEMYPILMTIQLSITQELDAMINGMAEDLGDSKGHTILRAIALLKTAMDAREEGKKIAIVDDESEQEILF